VAFQVADLHDLLALLRDHPEWRDQLRRELLADDFLALPGLVRQLAETQERTDARIAELA